VLGQVTSTAIAFSDGVLVNGRYQGSATHPNFFAFGGLLATVALFHLWHRTPARYHWVIWACGAVTAYSVSMSGSRGALLSLALVIAAYPLIERSVMSAYVLIATTLAAVPSVGWLLDTFAKNNTALGRLFGDSTTAYSDETRTQALSSGWDRFMSSPIIGTGYDNLLETHNVMLQVAIAVGVLGLVAWLLLMTPFVTPIVGNHPLRRLSYITLAYVAMGMTEPSLWERLVWCPLAVALLAAVPLRADDPDAPQNEVPLPQTTTSPQEIS
jgi:O-antigen ligase